MESMPVQQQNAPQDRTKNVGILVDEIVKTPDEWCREFDVTIMDPDGWRPGCSLGYKQYSEPITKNEFRHRMYESTASIIGKAHEA